MTYLHSAKKLQPNEIIRHIERSAAQMPFEEIKCPEFQAYLKILHVGYKFSLPTLSKNCGFAVPIFPSLIFSKKRRTQHIVVRL